MSHSIPRDRLWQAMILTAVLVFVPATPALASTGQIPAELGTAAGALALIAAAVLLREMLGLRAVARGAAIADNVSYVVLAAMCLAASVLLGWIARFIPGAFSAEHARLGADLLSVVAIVFFVIYFARVRAVMRRFVERVSGEQQILAGVIEPGDGE